MTIKEKKREEYLRNRESYLRRARQRYLLKTEECNAVNKEWAKNNRERRRLHQKRYYIANIDKIREKNRILSKRFYHQTGYYRKNKAKIVERNYRYKQNRILCDPAFKTLDYMRRRINSALKQRPKHGKTVELLGCSIPDLMIYLESRFEPEMNWDNYGKVWHVDHIMPCAIFDLSKPEHQKRCFHFSNLQPLFAADNLRKQAKVLSNQFNLL